MTPATIKRGRTLMGDGAGEAEEEVEGEGEAAPEGEGEAASEEPAEKKSDD